MPEKTTDRIPGWQGGSADGARGLGADLRARREELGWALPDVANWLRIREAYLLALEEGNTSVFPGSAYALGFLRSYAQALGMDPDHAVSRFRQDMRGALDRKPELSFPEPVSERGVPVGLWVGAGLAVLVGTYIGYYHFFGADPAPTHQMPPVAEIMPGVTQHGTPSPQIAAVMPDRGLAPSPQNAPSASPALAQTSPVSSGTQASLPQSQSVAPAAMTGSNPAIVTAAPQNGQPAPPLPSAVTSQPGANQSALPGSTQSVSGQPGSTQSVSSQSGVSQLPAAATASAGPTASTASAAPANMIVLHAGADAWVSIRDKAGATVFSRVLKSGETWQGPEDAGPYRMTLGNAGGLTLSAGDVTTSALGRVGAVRRGLVVTAAAIRNGQLGQDSAAGTPVVPAASGVSPETGDTPTSQNTAPVLKKAATTPKVTAATHESETDRLNARQLEQTAQPR
ncbi:RodZ domain-containing protein [Asaia sp. HN010]|uniref:helix-turn-helix domain-containing protein n=1 Tax=Asaia sp. HN010 TaxID=3081233 RepID=UPI0030197D96